MPALNLQGITVHFPYEPYKCQEIYMNSVISALKNGEHALLESPTGTGKTLCLLCATIGFILHQKKLHGSGFSAINTNENINRLPPTIPKLPNTTSETPPYPNRIIYTSRTHSQLKQVISEIKRTEYVNDKNFVMSVIGSRDHLCVNPRLKKFDGAKKDNACRQLCSKKACGYANSMKRKESSWKHNFSKAMDIEELAEAGRKEFFCSFYAAREIHNEAIIVFSPYGYIFDATVNKTINLTNTILCVDEAHNIESVCEEAASFDMSVPVLGQCLKELKSVCEHSAGQLSSKLAEKREKDPTGEGNETEMDLSITDISEVLALFDRLKNLFALLIKIPLIRLDVIQQEACILLGEQFLELLRQLQLTSQTWSRTDALLSMVEDLILVNPEDNTAKIVTETNGKGTPLVRRALNRIFDAEKSAKDYIVLIRHEDSVVPTGREKKKGGSGFSNMEKRGEIDDLGEMGDNGRHLVLSLWCFSSSFIMFNVLKKGVANLILTSGTLSPLDAFANNMGDYGNHQSLIKFPHRLQNLHAAKSNQVKAIILSTGPTNKDLLAVYERRNSVDYLDELGTTIQKLTQRVIGGVVVVFSSYSQMEGCIKHWKKSNLYASIDANKKIFCEPSDTHELEKVLTDYKNTVENACQQNYKLYGNAHYLNKTTASYLSSQHNMGGMLLIVSKGKAAEGLNLNDHLCRQIILCGIPFASLKDTRIILKRNHINDNIKFIQQQQQIQYALKQGEANGDKIQNKNAVLNNQNLGNKWYLQQAICAVNQSLGRVLRHVNDYGMCILLDPRYASNQWLASYPKWLQDSVSISKNFKEAETSVDEFFQGIPISLQKMGVEKLLKGDKLSLVANPIFHNDTAPSENRPMAIENSLSQAPLSNSISTSNSLGGFLVTRKTIITRQMPVTTTTTTMGDSLRLSSTSAATSSALLSTPRIIGVSAKSKSINDKGGVKTLRNAPPVGNSIRALFGKATNASNGAVAVKADTEVSVSQSKEDVAVFPSVSLSQTAMAFSFDDDEDEVVSSFPKKHKFA